MDIINKKHYNTTDLNPELTFKNHVYHRDHFAHYLRWSHIIKNLRKLKNKNISICDFGCGKGNLAEVIYRNRMKVKKYTGIDIRNVVNEKLKVLDWVQIITDDLINPMSEWYKYIEADIVCSFEVIEHVGKNNVTQFLKKFKECGNYNAIYYLSTPNYDEKVGAAKNHIFDSGDGRGESVQEFSHLELENHISDAGFKIINKYGTFASIKDYKHKMDDFQEEIFTKLRKYYDTEILSVLMAPMFPEESRNCLWVLEKKQ